MKSPIMKSTTSATGITVTKGRWAGLVAQAHIDTPLGAALLVASDTGLAGFWFEGQAHHPLAATYRDATTSPAGIAAQVATTTRRAGPASGSLSATATASPVRFDLPEAPAHPLLAPAISQLADYWRGERCHFDLALDMRGTPFQQAVWRQLLAIGCGVTSTYGAIATQIGKSAAVRAVGAAVGRNPVSVIVPCHRVLGSNGDLTGYAGGLDRKRALLRLETTAKPILPAQVATQWSAA
jgi:methylated-DNA-[protein]-cysteine S-methyltransferase